MAPSYRSYRSQYLEHLAGEMVGRYGRYLDDQKLAVDVELMIQNQGYHVVTVEKLPKYVEAYIAYKVKKVFVRAAGDCPNRQRMTLAEELAHIFLHIPELLRYDPNDPWSIVEKYSPLEYDLLERDAKHLAGALLMDGAKFRKLLRKYSSANFGRNLSVRKSDHLWPLRQVASDFNVGITCATRRGFQLGLVEKEVLDLVSS